MDDPLRAIAAAHGVFLYREAIDAGYNNKAIAARRRSGEWHRVRHGAYCFGDVWATLSEPERHRVLTRAVLRMTPGPVALSHVTALVFHGVAVWGADLSKVHVTRLAGGAGRNERDVVHHQGLCEPERDLIELDGQLVTAPNRALIESTTVLGIESSLVSFNDALHHELVMPPELHETFDRMTNWPESCRTHVVLHHMDGRAASIGETRSDYMFWQQGLPRPDLQRAVLDETGAVFATTDFAWDEYRLFGEFDGKEKYLRYLREGETPGDAVFREKQREDKIRRLTGWRFVRIVWADLYHPARVAAYIRSLMRAAA